MIKTVQIYLEKLFFEVRGEGKLLLFVLLFVVFLDRTDIFFDAKFG